MRAILRLAAILSILGGIALISWSLQKNISLTDNGQRQSLETAALTVGDLLRSSAIQLHPGDEVIPQPSSWLRDGDAVTIQRAAQILIQADGKIEWLVTTERRPANLLLMLGIRLYPGDRITADGLPADPDQPLTVKPVHSLQLRRAQPVELAVSSPAQNDEGEVTQSQKFASSAASLGEALWEAGIQLYDQDQIEPELESPLDRPRVATLQASQQLAVRSKAGTSQVRTSNSSVGTALASAGMPLQGLDYSIPNLAGSLPTSGEIRIIRVQEKLILEQEPIPFENQYQPDSNLELDSQVVLQAGVPGMRTRRIRVRLENGREAARSVDAEFISQPPQAQIIGVGTKVSLQTLNTPGGPIKYWRSKSVYATSYSPCRIFKDRCDSVTASGATLQKGVVAVTGEWYRYLGGTQIYVPGYGVGTIADVGGGIPGQAWIDLGYSESDYVSWHQTVTIYFLAPAPEEIPWILR